MTSDFRSVTLPAMGENARTHKHPSMPRGRTRRSGRRLLQTACAAAAFAVVASCAPSGGGGPTVTVTPHTIINSADGSGRGTLTVDGCVLLDTSSVFTQRIDALPAASFAPGADPIARAASMLDAVGQNSLGSGSSTSAWQGSVFGMPLVGVDGAKRTVTIGTSTYGYQALPVFLPADGAIHWENEPSVVAGDLHLAVLDRSSCTLQEHIGYNDLMKSSAVGVQWGLPISSSAGKIRTDGHGPGTAEAAGLPLAPLVYRFDEVYPAGVGGPVGQINHALRIVFPKDVNSLTATVWPARWTDGTATVADALPMGARLRLSAAALARLEADATVPAGTRAILAALHRYGAVVADSSGPTTDPTPGGFGLTGEYNPAWPAGVTGSLSKVRAEDFEVVDVACWQGTAQFNVKAPVPNAC